MATRMRLQRLVWLTVLLGAAFMGLGYRLVELQVVRHADLSAKAQQNSQREYLLEPRRGDILDARGTLLATSVFVKTVCADPSLLGNRQAEVARVLAPLLQEDETKLLARLTPRVRQNEKGETLTNRFVVLKRRVPTETWEQIQTAMTNLTFSGTEGKLSPAERTFYRNLRQKAVFARNEQLRTYPNQALAAHVLGHATAEELEVNDMPSTEISGQDGIELAFDAKLKGMRGWRVTETDRRNREVVPWREQEVEPRDGLNVVLTVDSVIQTIVEGALADAMAKHTPISISGIVVRPRTGEILAMATLPTYDPNKPEKASLDARRNRVISDILEPGSTFKIVVVSGALSDGLVQPTDMFDCEHGRFHFAGRVLHDHESYGALSVQSIITKSSNIGAAKIGIKMGADRLYSYIRDYGFGTSTGLPLPGEVGAGAYVKPVKKWSKVSIAQIPMGQGISVTRLQMVMAMAAIANDGVLMRPMLVDRLEDRNHNVVAKYSPQKVRRVISDAGAKMMVTALKTVVAPDGTAPKAALEHYTVAGKTGTAQKVENKVYVHKYFASFVGFFPADNPELCISVVLDEPKHGYYGGQTAAPVFKQIAERTAAYLGIRPEDNVEQPTEPEILTAPADPRSIKTTAARSE